MSHYLGFALLWAALALLSCVVSFCLAFSSALVRCTFICTFFGWLHSALLAFCFVWRYFAWLYICQPSSLALCLVFMICVALSCFGLPDSVKCCESGMFCFCSFGCLDLFCLTMLCGVFCLRVALLSFWRCLLDVALLRLALLPVICLCVCVCVCLAWNENISQLCFALLAFHLFCFTLLVFTILGATLLCPSLFGGAESTTALFVFKMWNLNRFTLCGFCSLCLATVRIALPLRYFGVALVCSCVTWLRFVSLCNDSLRFNFICS